MSYIPHAYVARTNNGGNYCGHDPAMPAFTLARPAPLGKGGIPRILTLCMERLEAYYYRPRQVIPALDLANNSARKQRSERRESCICVLAALLKRTDVASLRVGQPGHDGVFHNYPFTVIVKDTGLNYKRVKRAVRDLRLAGLLTVSQPREKLPDGSWKGLAAVKAVSKKLFSLFGLGVMLRLERQKRAKKRKPKVQPEQSPEDTTMTDRARFSNFMDSMMAKLGMAQKSKQKTREPQTDFEYQKQLSSVAGRLKDKNPNWDRDRCFREAAIQLQGS